MMQKFQTKNLTDATPAEVRWYGQAFLGLPVDDANDSEVLAKVRAASEGDTIYVPAEMPETDQTGSPPPKPASGGGIVGGLGHGDPKVTITLHAEERDGVVVNRHKEVGVNGVVWLLKRGESITIPYRVFEALENAERNVITHTTEGEVREQKVKNTPYNIERMPAPEVLAAWHMATDSQEIA